MSFEKSMPRKSFKTEKGTELPLINLKGKEYLQVAHRLVWFREKFPSGIIKTAMIEKGGEGQDEFTIFKAEIYADSERGPQLLATAHKRESRKDFSDFVEKCETSAVGRALAMIGVGTQFCSDELDEGDRLADAPLDAPVSAANDTTIEASPKRTSFRKKIEAANTTTANGSDL